MPQQRPSNHSALRLNGRALASKIAVTRSKKKNQVLPLRLLPGLFGMSCTICAITDGTPRNHSYSLRRTSLLISRIVVLLMYRRFLTRTVVCGIVRVVPPPRHSRLVEIRSGEVWWLLLLRLTAGLVEVRSEFWFPVTTSRLHLVEWRV